MASADVGIAPGACSGGMIYSLILMSRCRRALQTGHLGISVCLATAVRPRGGSQAGDAPDLGAAAPCQADPGRETPNPRVLAPKVGNGNAPEARTARLDGVVDLGHRPRKPTHDAEQGPRHCLHPSAAELSPVGASDGFGASSRGPLRDAAGCEGGGDRQPQATRSLKPQAPFGDGKPVLAW
jgi:hypothetical protein